PLCVLLLLPPPPSSLFPYTTLFRSRLLEIPHVLLHVLAVPLEVEDRVADELAGPVVGRLPAAVGLDDIDFCSLGDVQLARVRTRSEEHTSELQSHLNLVCRLLLEKK